ncbi:MAG: hydrogenase nickel incorporation protein HypA [Candidatus Bathyarchaeota archaeon]|nr:hydrogenase nickel incorporation protein HypA [Candidatus Bathyarchaeota archaeon]MCX8176700.1 hydrogenase nickel incorporation protein HypA [Candidatus Bathyarchaeota archaeon]MDW8193228.1 hydrogenase nickel incorporation protein HypA [Nitrososphaerota archaeon]
MHEWALAEAVVSAVSQIAQREGLKFVSQVKIMVGELQQVELDIFEFALTQLKSGILEKAKFVLETVPARLLCRVCGKEWSFARNSLARDASEAVHFIPEAVHAYVRCPKCGSPDYEVVTGRGVWIESIKGVQHP